MLARRHKIIVGLITGSALLLFFSPSPQIIDHVANVSMTAPYSGKVDSKGEDAFTPPDLSKSAAIMETTLPGGAPAPGFTIFDRLYVWNGTIYAVTSNPRAFPQLRYIISQPKDQVEGNDLEPTSRVSPWMFVVSLC
jgi:protein O-GlcNAc transferase